MVDAERRQECQASDVCRSLDCARLVSLLEHARCATIGFLEGVPPERYCWQPYAGANHVMWVLGHLAVTDGFALRQLGKRAPALPEAYQTLFGPGSTPVEDSGVYPNRTQALEVLQAQRDRLLAVLDTMGDESLAQPLSEDIRWFAADGVDLFLKLCWHEGLHAGQITAVRKSLHLGPWRM